MGCTPILSILDGLGDLVRFRDGCQAPAKEEHEGHHQSPNDLLWHTAATCLPSAAGTLLVLVLCVYVHGVCTELCIYIYFICGAYIRI